MKSLFFALGTISLLTFTSCDLLKHGATVATAMNSIPSNDEVIKGLKEALVLGTGNGSSRLGQAGGFFNNAALKILFPSEAQKVEEKLRAIGLGAKVDQAIKALNDGAEAAMIEAKPIFVNAITSMSFSDAMGILKGGNGAATSYLKNTTSESLKTTFRPKIQAALDKVSATKYWDDVITTYNALPFVTKVNPDLAGYVTDKAMFGLFSEIEKEENIIRQDPLKRTSQLLKKVFDYADTQKNP